MLVIIVSYLTHQGIFLQFSFHFQENLFLAPRLWHSLQFQENANRFLDKCWSNTRSIWFNLHSYSIDVSRLSLSKYFFIQKRFDYFMFKKLLLTNEISLTFFITSSDDLTYLYFIYLLNNVSDVYNQEVNIWSLHEIFTWNSIVFLKFLFPKNFI